MNEPELWPRKKDQGEDNCMNQNSNGCFLLSSYYVPGIVLSTEMMYHLILQLLHGKLLLSTFLNEKTEA